MMKLIILFAILAVINASYSISYYSKDGNKDFGGQSILIQQVPSAEQVADVYARISGHQPTLREDDIDLPTRNIWLKRETPVLLEVHGGGQRLCLILTSLNICGLSDLIIFNTRSA